MLSVLSQRTRHFRAVVPPVGFTLQERVTRIVMLQAWLPHEKDAVAREKTQMNHESTKMEFGVCFGAQMRKQI